MSSTAVVSLYLNGWFSFAMQKSPQYQLWSSRQPAYWLKPNWSNQLLQISNTTKKIDTNVYNHDFLYDSFAVVSLYDMALCFSLRALYEIKERQRPKLRVEYPGDPTTPYNHSPGPAWIMLFGLSQSKSNFSHSASVIIIQRLCLLVDRRSNLHDHFSDIHHNSANLDIQEGTASLPNLLIFLEILLHSNMSLDEL